MSYLYARYLLGRAQGNIRLSRRQVRRTSEEPMPWRHEIQEAELRQRTKLLGLRQRFYGTRTGLERRLHRLTQLEHVCIEFVVLRKLFHDGRFFAPRRTKALFEPAGGIFEPADRRGGTLRIISLLL